MGSGGGEQQLMPRQMIQDAADALREARIAEQAAVAGTAAQQQPTGQEGDPTEEVTEQPVSLSEEEADDLILLSANRAQEMPVIEFTPENWATEFPDGKVETPLGEVKIREFDENNH